jgi:hypothetical protein
LLTENASAYFDSGSEGRYEREKRLKRGEATKGQNGLDEKA